MYTLTQSKTKVDEIVQDDASKLTPTEKASFLQEAVRIYSKHRPCQVVKDITGDGTYDYAITTHLTSWIKDFSVIKSIEYPADEQSPEYLDENEWIIYEKQTGEFIRFLEDSPLATETIRVIYTALHILDDVLVEDCEDAWNEYVSANVTSALETVDIKVGAGAVKLTIADGAAANELLATEVIAVSSLVNYTHIGAWMKSTIALSANDLQLLLDDTAQCATPLETLAIPVLTANVWTWVEMALANPATDLNLISVGIKQRLDKGAFVLKIDDVRGIRNTIPESDQDAVCNLAASLCSGALASTYAHMTDSTITADSVDHKSKSEQFAARAREQKKNYLNHLGIKEGASEVAPASAVKDLDLDYPWGGDRLTHPKKWR